MKILSCS